MNALNIKLRWATFLPHILANKGKIVRANVAVLLVALFTLPTPTIIPFAIEKYTTDSTTDNRLSFFFNWLTEGGAGVGAQLLVLFCLAFLLRVLVILLNKAQYKLFVGVTCDIGVSMRAMLFEHIFKMNMKEARKFTSSSLTTRTIYDVDAVCDFLCNLLGRLVASIFIIIFSLIILLHINLFLGACIFLIYPVVLFYWAKLAMGFTAMKKHEKEAQELFGASFSESFDSISTLKALSGGEHYYGRLMDKSVHLRDKSGESRIGSYVAIQHSTFLLNFGIDFFQFSTLIIAILSNLSISEILIIYGYLWLVQSPILDIIQLKNSYYTASASLRRINELLCVEIEPAGGVIDHKRFENGLDIILEQLTFSYSPNSTLYKNLNFTIKSGDFISIGGESGCGKSTLVNLLIGFCYPDSGRILYSDKTIYDIGADELRKSVVAVLQDSHIFSLSIRENLAMGRPVSEQKLRHVVNLCQLGSFIDELEEGLETMLGDGGIAISGGQKQRISIARAILAEPKVVIFDEATSALDLKTERCLYEAILPFMKSRTFILISHRQESLKLANRQYLIRNGEIKEAAC